MVKVILVVIVLGVTIFALIDLFSTPAHDVRGGSRLLWALPIVLLPMVGAVLWLLMGRATDGDSGPRLLPPDDDPDFLRGLRP